VFIALLGLSMYVDSFLCRYRTSSFSNRSHVVYLVLRLHVLIFTKPRYLSEYEVLVRGWTTRVQFLAGSMVGFFLFATTSRPALGPTQPPVQWVAGACSYSGGKAPTRA